MKYKIKEISRSIQWEGQMIGTPAIFIRLSDCNLNCPLCGTKHEEEAVMDENEIFEKINDINYPSAPLFVITGGEPTIFDCEDLLARLKVFPEVTIAMESNGTNYEKLSKWKAEGDVNLLSITRNDSTLTEDIKTSLLIADEVRIVYDGKINPRIFEPYLNDHFRFQTAFITPNSKDNFDPAMKWVMDNPNWRLENFIK